MHRRLQLKITWTRKLSQQVYGTHLLTTVTACNFSTNWSGRWRQGTTWAFFIMHKYYQLQLLHIHHIQWWAVAAEQKYDRGRGVCRVTNLATKIFVRDLYFSTVHSTATRRDWTMGWVHAILILSYLVTCLYAQGEMKVYRILLQILQKLVLQPHAVIAYVDIRLNRM